MLHGIWVDDRPERVLGDGYLSWLRDLGVQVAAVMIHNGPGRPLAYSARDIERICELARGADLEVVLTCWPHPASYAHLLAQVAPLLASGVSALEVDLEGQWTKQMGWGEAGLRRISEDLVARCRDITDPLDVRLDVTSHVAHREAGPEALVAPAADRIYVQAYSIAHRGGRRVAVDGTYGPGGMQHRAWARASTVPGVAHGRPRVCAGLACWDQEWAGLDAAEAMRRAYEAAAGYEPVEIRWWSARWARSRRYLSDLLQD